MKKFFLLSFLIIATISAALSVTPTNGTISARLVKQWINNESENEQSPGTINRRIPKIRVDIVIDYEEGVQIPDQDSDEILTYQVWNEEGECLLDTEEERSFIDFIYELEEGYYEIVLLTETLEYSGTVVIYN